MVFPVNYVSANKIADFLNKNVFSMKKAGLSSVDAATVNNATNELIVFGMPSDAAIVKKVIEQLLSFASVLVGIRANLSVGVKAVNNPSITHFKDKKDHH